MTISAQHIHDKIREITSAGQFFELEDRELAGRRVRVSRPFSGVGCLAWPASRPAQITTRAQSSRDAFGSQHLTTKAPRHQGL